MKNWHPVSVIVVILTVTVSSALVAATVIPVITKTPMPADVMKLMDTLYTSIIAIITLYVGAMVQKSKEKP
jgi:hypothetical protein